MIPLCLLWGSLSVFSSDSRTHRPLRTSPCRHLLGLSGCHPAWWVPGSVKPSSSGAMYLLEPHPKTKNHPLTRSAKAGTSPHFYPFNKHRGIQVASTTCSAGKRRANTTDMKSLLPWVPRPPWPPPHRPLLQSLLGWPLMALDPRPHPPHQPSRCHLFW